MEARDETYQRTALLHYRVVSGRGDGMQQHGADLAKFSVSSIVGNSRQQSGLGPDQSILHCIGRRRHVPMGGRPRQRRTDHSDGSELIAGRVPPEQAGPVQDLPFFGRANVHCHRRRAVECESG